MIISKAVRSLLYNKSFGVVRYCMLLTCYLAIYTCACSRMPQSVGRSKDVVIVSTHIDTNLILENVQIHNFVPQEEPLFKLFFTYDTAIQRFNTFHTMFLYGSLQDEFIDVLLSPDAKSATQEDTFTLFKINNVWAHDQLVVILAISDPRYVHEAIEKYGPLVRTTLEEHYYQKIRATQYGKKRDHNVESILRDFGISLEINEGWLIDSTYKTDNFIFVHTHFPDRSIFLYKEPASQELNSAFAIEKRNQLTKAYYNGDYILTDLTYSKPIEFKNMRGVSLRGVWQNDSLVAGGPFITYFLVFGDSLYILDGMLFNPGERKSDFLTSLEVILNSFEITVSDME